MSELTFENVSIALKQLQMLRASTNYFWEMLSKGQNDGYSYKKTKENDENGENCEDNKNEMDNEDVEATVSSQKNDKDNQDRQEYLLKLKNSLKETSNIFT